MSNSPSPSEDLSFLRSLAESGRDAPLMAGPYLIAGGGWFAAASLIQWLPIRGIRSSPRHSHQARSQQSRKHQ
jgi:hypothetical protein